MQQLHGNRWEWRAKRGQMGLLLTLAVILVGGTWGCGGGSAKTSASQGTTATGSQATGTQGTATQGSGTQETLGGIGEGFTPQISGIVSTSDITISPNGTVVPLGGATIVVDNASGAKVAQTQTAPDGTYDIPVPEGVYTVVPAPFTVGSVTLTAPPQQVTVKFINRNGETSVPITYTRSP